MTEAQSRAAKRRYEREHTAVCPACNGRGTVNTKTPSSRARQGGVAAYLKSLQPGQMSMSERGKLGGRPPEPTLADLGVQVEKGDAAPDDLDSLLRFLNPLD